MNNTNAIAKKTDQHLSTAELELLVNQLNTDPKVAAILERMVRMLICMIYGVEVSYLYVNNLNKKSDKKHALRPQINPVITGVLNKFLGLLSQTLQNNRRYDKKFAIALQKNNLIYFFTNLNPNDSKNIANIYNYNYISECVKKMLENIQLEIQEEQSRQTALRQIANHMFNSDHAVQQIFALQTLTQDLQIFSKSGLAKLRHNSYFYSITHELLPQLIMLFLQWNISPTMAEACLLNSVILMMHYLLVVPRTTINTIDGYLVDMAKNTLSENIKAYLTKVINARMISEYTKIPLLIAVASIVTACVHLLYPLPYLAPIENTQRLFSLLVSPMLYFVYGEFFRLVLGGGLKYIAKDMENIRIELYQKLQQSNLDLENELDAIVLTFMISFLNLGTAIFKYGFNGKINNNFNKNSEVDFIQAKTPARNIKIPQSNPLPQNKKPHSYFYSLTEQTVDLFHFGYDKIITGLGYMRQHGLFSVLSNSQQLLNNQPVNQQLNYSWFNNVIALNQNIKDVIEINISGTPHYIYIPPSLINDNYQSIVECYNCHRDTRITIKPVWPQQSVAIRFELPNHSQHTIQAKLTHEWTPKHPKRPAVFFVHIASQKLNNKILNSSQDIYIAVGQCARLHKTQQSENLKIINNFVKNLSNKIIQIESYSDYPRLNLYPDYSNYNLS